MESNEILDQILKSLQKAHNNRFPKTIDSNGNSRTLLNPDQEYLDWIEIIVNGNFNKSDVNTLSLAIDFLFKANYIKPKTINNKEKYAITFEGLKFIENGGYKGEFNRNSVAERRVRVSHALTWILAVSSFVAGSYYMTEMWNCKNVVKAIEVSTFLFVFLFGVIAGIIIYKLISNQKEKKE